MSAGLVCGRYGAAAAAAVAQERVPRSKDRSDVLDCMCCKSAILSRPLRQLSEGWKQTVHAYESVSSVFQGEAA